MTCHSSKILDNDDAMNFIAFLEQASDQGRVIRDVLGAILEEDDHVPAEVMRIGIACAVLVALQVDSRIAIEALRSREISPTVTPEIRMMARDLLRFAMTPRDPIRGTNGLYAQWKVAGEMHEACKEMGKYLKVLAGPDLHLTCWSSDESLESDYPLMPLPEGQVIESERLRIRQLASSLRAINIETFNDPKDDFWYSDFVFERKICEFAGGAIIDGCRSLIDDIFDDLKLLDVRGGSLASAGPEDFKFLDVLPWRFASLCDSSFVRKFAVTAIGIAHGLIRDNGISCTSTAVDFVLRSLSWKVECLIQAYAGLDEVGGQALAQRVARELHQSENRRDLWELSRSSSHYRISRMIPFISDGYDGPPRLIQPDRWFLPFAPDESASPYFLY
ncbi:DUF4259 domain-containing protein [Microbispora rosea]|uniref:DUF4259 domain-containing protein n=1 Tax=Microbispora rosea TaxID=58117 RepID=UPI0036B5F811